MVYYQICFLAAVCYLTANLLIFRRLVPLLMSLTSFDCMVDTKSALK